MRLIIQDYIPFMRWIREYKVSYLRNDMVAGATIWAVMVPTALAYTSIAGVDPIVGLYTVPLTLIMYALFGTSKCLVVGPDSATALLSAHIVGTLAVAHTHHYLMLTSSLALFIGTVFLIFGFLKMGWIADFISIPVMHSFIQGLAIVTMMTQLPKLFGVASVQGDFIPRLLSLIKHMDQTNFVTLGIGLGALVLLYIIPKISQKIPSAIVTVIIGILTVYVFDLKRYDVAVVGSLKGSLPPFGVPHFAGSDIRILLFGALAIVLLNYTESLGAAKEAAERRGEQIDNNQELIGLGASNIGASLSSGFVVAGSLSQSTVSMLAGGKTQMSNIFHAVLILLTLLFLMPLFKNLPLAVLGAIVTYAMIKVINHTVFTSLYRASKPEFWIGVVTFSAVLFLGVLQGVGTGIFLSLVLLVYHNTHPKIDVLGEMKEPGVYKNIALHPDAVQFEHILIIRFGDSLFFANANYFVDEVRNLCYNSERIIENIIVDVERVSDIDITALALIEKLQRDLNRRGISLSFARVNDDIREELNTAIEKEGLKSILLFDRISTAVNHFTQQSRPQPRAVPRTESASMGRQEHVE
jgi:SulP family sulfate permease